MNVSSLSLRDLEYLVAVADHQHFGKAAEACHVSQPALSSQVAKLENLLGVKLFERSNRRVAITSEGQLVAEQARVVLEEAAKIPLLAARVAEPLCGSLRLGAIATVGPYLMPHLIPKLRKHFPKLQLLLREGLTANLVAELRSGSLDAVIAASTSDMEGLTASELFWEPFVLAAPRHHRLSGKTSVQATDLRSEEMVLLEDGHCLRNQMVDVCPRNRRGNFKEFHATSLETLRHLVASGVGCTLIPQLALKSSHGLQKLIRYRPFTGKPVGRKIVLVCRSRFSRMKDLEVLAEFIRANVKPLLVAPRRHS
jgi:LysR family hydrogen peroxide-inducible transcriptional activator